MNGSFQEAFTKKEENYVDGVVKKNDPEVFVKNRFNESIDSKALSTIDLLSWSDDD